MLIGHGQRFSDVDLSNRGRLIRNPRGEVSNRLAAGTAGAIELLKAQALGAASVR
jgi:hypothetical protein